MALIKACINHPRVRATHRATDPKDDSAPKRWLLVCSPCAATLRNSRVEGVLIEELLR